MISDQSTVLLRSGETVTAAEVFEAFALLAFGEATHPLLTPSDRRIAVIETAFQALDWAEERGVL